MGAAALANPLAVSPVAGKSEASRSNDIMDTSTGRSGDEGRGQVEQKIDASALPPAVRNGGKVQTQTASSSNHLNQVAVGGMPVGGAPSSGES